MNSKLLRLQPELGGMAKYCVIFQSCLSSLLRMFLAFQANRITPRISGLHASMLARNASPSALPSP